MQEYIIELGSVKTSDHLMDFEHSFGRFIKMCKKGVSFFQIYVIMNTYFSSSIFIVTRYRAT